MERIEREQVVMTLRIYGEELRVVAQLDFQLGEDVWREPDGALMKALLRACRRAEVPIEALREAIEADRSLEELTDAVIREALVTAPDPGPYDVISREASSGTPENRHEGAIGRIEVGLPWRDHWW